MFIRALVGAIIGVIGGATAGAVTFGWNASMALGSSWIFGMTKNWWRLDAMAGAVAGAIFGLALSLYISLTSVGMRPAIITGGSVGAFGALVMLFMQADGAFWWHRSVPSRAGPLLLSTIGFALIGLLLSVITSKMANLQ